MELATAVPIRTKLVVCVRNFIAAMRELRFDPFIRTILESLCNPDRIYYM